MNFQTSTVVILFCCAIIVIPIFVVVGNAQMLYVDARVGDLNDIRESKYMASAVTVVRNSDGELISVTRADATRYLDNAIIDRFLEGHEENVVKRGIINQQTVSMYQIAVEYDALECLEKVFDVPGYSDECSWYHRAFVTMLSVLDEKGEQREIFRGLNHVFPVQSLDQITSFWTILVKD